MKNLKILSLALLVMPAVAATPKHEALARELLVCAGMFGGLAFIGVHGGGSETYRFLDAAKRIAGNSFVERELGPANERAADWVFSKPSPTLDQAHKSCLPLLEKAGK